MPASPRPAARAAPTACSPRSTPPSLSIHRLGGPERGRTPPDAGQGRSPPASLRSWSEGRRSARAGSGRRSPQPARPRPPRSVPAPADRPPAGGPSDGVARTAAAASDARRLPVAGSAAGGASGTRSHRVQPAGRDDARHRASERSACAAPRSPRRALAAASIRAIDRATPVAAAGRDRAVPPGRGLSRSPRSTRPGRCRLLRVRHIRRSTVGQPTDAAASSCRSRLAPRSTRRPARWHRRGDP